MDGVPRLTILELNVSLRHDVTIWFMVMSLLITFLPNTKFLFSFIVTLLINPGLTWHGLRH